MGLAQHRNTHAIRIIEMMMGMIGHLVREDDDVDHTLGLRGISSNTEHAGSRVKQGGY